ncbi:MAG: beta/gamma crystallin-related protein [Pseudomonadota bacterium]
MTKHLKAALAIATAALASQAFADVTLYQVENLRGRAITATGDIPNLEGYGFNDRASSIEVTGDRRDRWEVCEGAGYTGRCAVLRPGAYNTILSLGLNNRISSVRQIRGDEVVADSRYAPAWREDYRRRDSERLFEARVVDVRAVVAGPTQQRCWIEREQVVSNAPANNVGGAVAGALIGGILGHQIGGGSGRDAATALGAVGGAAIGANNIGTPGSRVVTQDVQRCEQRANYGRPDYYDVSYVFEGREHRVQMATPPGATVLVNGNGEPRV